MKRIVHVLTGTIVFCCAGSVLCCAKIAPSQEPPIPPPAEEPKRSNQQPNDRFQRPFQVSDRTGSRFTFGHLAESPGLHVTQDIFTLLQYERIHRAIDLSREQMAKIAETEVKNIRSRQEMLRELDTPAGPIQTPEHAKARRRVQEKFYALREQRFREILKPEQLNRLTQIALELRIQSIGIVAILSDPQMAAELDLSDTQLADLRKQAGEQSMELDKKLMELKREIRTELTGVLTETQRLQLQSMLGKPFQWREDKQEE